MLLNHLCLTPMALTDAPAEGGIVLRSLYNVLCDSIANETLQSVLLVVSVLICIASAYLIGSINPAIIFSNKIYHEDIRSHGSGNAGATNILRTYGKKMAALIFAIDFFKAIIAVLIGTAILSITVGGAISALFVVLGHMFPVYHKFKGGKGVACTAACILMLSPLSFAILLPMFIVIVLCTKYISLGSIMCALLFPLFAFSLRNVFWGGGGFITLSAMMIAGFVVFMHRENIKRLMEGKENKVSFSPKSKQETEVKAQETKSAEPDSKKEYSDDNFIKCSCGRIIPKTREVCVYCGEKNPYFIPSEKKNNKKK